MTKRPLNEDAAKPESSDAANKKAKTLAMQMVVSPQPQPKTSADQAVEDLLDHDTVTREQRRYTIELNPIFLKRLSNRGEIGFKAISGKVKFEIKVYDIDVKELRTTLQSVLSQALTVRYLNVSSLRQSEITAEIEEIVPLTISTCMSALYAKLRNIHRSYGKYPTRYTSAPGYTKEIELPLPFATMIQQFGSFQTHSLQKNYVIMPSYPEGTKYEGREFEEFKLADYLSYVPRLRELGIPMKSVDTRSKLGTAWWTYRILNYNSTFDLVCTLPPSHYTDLSAILRSCLLQPNTEKMCNDIVKHEDSAPHYGIKMREVKPGTNVRSFLALCHGPEEEWSLGAC